MNATKTTNGENERPKYEEVTMTFESLPLWGPVALFNLLHERMGQPDLDGVEASLTIKYSNMTEADKAKLSELQDELWLSGFRGR